VSSGWWRTYFGDDFYQLHVDLFPEEVSRREVAGMIELLALPQDARILDVPCGWARHTTLLREAGFDAVGADLSWDLLRRADRSQRLPLAAADIRALPFADAAFDAAVNVFTSLGLFLTDDEDVCALREIRRVLRPGGWFLLESMHRDEIIGAYAVRDRWILPDGTEVRVRRRFDPVRGISYERLRWRRGDDGGEKRHALRLRTATEIDALVRAAGFRDLQYFGDWDGSPLSHDSESLILVARA
jgi:SAM-dependent methyltransferase